MHAEDLVIDNRTHWKAIKAIRECLPKTDAVAALALVIEAIDSVNRRTLMVASQEKEILRVFHLVCEEEADGLKALLPAVHIIS
mmetsp:Transcript_110817/g.203181  ORF Transcript_110817/g.203181 Transcript_110817/m.203181 type:complete len:84 (+) Transcript_110817:583-834(+)